MTFSNFHLPSCHLLISGIAVESVGTANGERFRTTARKSKCVCGGGPNSAIHLLQRSRAKGGCKRLEHLADGSGLSGVSNARHGRTAVTVHPGGNRAG